MCVFLFWIIFTRNPFEFYRGNFIQNGNFNLTLNFYKFHKLLNSYLKEDVIF